MTDDQDDHVHPSIMPHLLDWLGEQGTRFTNSFVDYPLCGPSRASFLTGQAAHNHGIRTNDMPGGAYRHFQAGEGNTLPVWLQQAGYVTAHMGKYVNGYGYQAGGPLHIPPGWSHWEAIPDTHGAYTYWNYSINVNGTLVSYGNTDAEYKTDVQAQRAAAFIAAQARSGRPWFLWLNPFAPHSANANPPQPPARYRNTIAPLSPLPPHDNEADISDKPAFMQAGLLALTPAQQARAALHWRRSREVLRAVDDLVDTVMRALQETGQLDTTLVIYTSDNGFVYGGHRFLLSKNTPYEEAVRVPLFIRGPGIAQGATQAALVNTLDLVATLVDLAQATPGRTLDGASLVPLLATPTLSWRAGLLVQGQVKFPGDSTVQSVYTAVHGGSFVLIRHVTGAQTVETEGYDLLEDPWQLQNVATAPGSAVLMAWGAAHLRRLQHCTGVGCWLQ
jgi:arylsulfatase A-like enzyme